VEAVSAKLVSALRRARHVAVLTGSGVSAESGIPTFREPQGGLWARYRPEDLAAPEAFERDPDLVWQWYQWRRSLIRAARPNPGHLALAALERLVPRMSLVTQNVDGLHQQAGSRGVIEFHGNIHRNRCSVEHTPVAIAEPELPRAPRCPACGARVRPDVVWFGEAVPRAALASATFAANDCDVYMAIGTSGVVQPAAALFMLARDRGALVLEINPQETGLSGNADLVVREPAGACLPALVAALG
jgi:NAD-dependent deacetylase